MSPEQTSEIITHSIDASGSEYSVPQLLHQGTLYEVYTAMHDGRRWILKRVNPRAKGEQELLRNILQHEYSLLQQIDSPYVVRARELVEIPHLGLCLVEEYIDGQTLDEWIRLHPSLSQRRQVMDELLQVFEYMHAKQLVYGDLKPQNILVSHNGQHVKLIDFGLTDEDGSITKNIGFTQEYAAPEQQEGKTTDCRTDIYALGHIMALLFPHQYLLQRHGCLARNPQHRFRSIRQLRRAIHGQRTVWVVALLILLAGSLWVANSLHQQEVVRDTEYPPISPSTADTTVYSQETLLTQVTRQLEQECDSICRATLDSIAIHPTDSMTLWTNAASEMVELNDRAQQQYPDLAADIMQYFTNYYHQVTVQPHFPK